VVFIDLAVVKDDLHAVLNAVMNLGGFVKCAECL